MSNRSEPIGEALLFLWAWWRLYQHPQIGGYAFFCALALWLVGWTAARMFSSAVHRQGFWGWMKMLEVAVWYGLALWLVPIDIVTTAFLLWGIATPLLFVGNIWRRVYERFLPIQVAMLAITRMSAIAGVVAVPFIAWQFGPDFPGQLALVSGVFAAGAGLLFYGWRLAGPPSGGQYDAKDAAGVVAHQTQDFVQFDLAPPLRVVGPDPKGLQDWFATWRGQIGYTIRDLHVTVGDDVAFCHGLIHLTGNRTDGSESDVWFRSTLCLRKAGDAWKIAHGHESVPMYMDGSFKAAIDLEP